jgi:iron(III) transport system ATP-binding protein
MGATTIVVTHDPEEAMRIADRIVLMRQGRIVQEGDAETIYRHPADIFAARFFCDFNEVEGIAEGGQVTIPLGSFPAAHLRDGQSGLVCVRPRGVQLRPPGDGLPGRIVSRRFLGELDLLHIAVQGLEAPLQARVGNRMKAEVGQDVGVHINPDEVLVFAAGDP